MRARKPFLICKKRSERYEKDQKSIRKIRKVLGKSFSSLFSLLIFITLLLYVKILYAVLIILAQLDLIFNIYNIISDIFFISFFFSLCPYSITRRSVQEGLFACTFKYTHSKLLTQSDNVNYG